MNKRIVLIIGILLMIAACVLGYFAETITSIPSLVTGSIALALICVNTWKKSEKKNGITAMSIAFTVAGVFFLVFASVSEQAITSLVTAIIGLVGIIAGIIVPIIQNAK